MTRIHWKLIQRFALAALLPLCAACSGEDDGLPQDADKQPVQVNITRATMDGSGNWSWSNGDQVGLSITDNEGTDTYTMTYNGSNWGVSTTLQPVNLPATAEAWYPASASMDKFEITHDNNAYELGTGNGVWIAGTNDQSTLDKLAAMDYMTTDAMTMSDASLDVTFRHRMCFVTVNIVNYDGFEFESASPTITNVRICSCTPIEKYGNEYDLSSIFNNIDVDPYVETDSDGTTRYKAMITTGYYNGQRGTLPLITMQVNGTSVSASYNNRLVSGNAYTFNLTVKNPNAATRSAGTPECVLELVETRDMNGE